MPHFISADGNRYTAEDSFEFKTDINPAHASGGPESDSDDVTDVVIIDDVTIDGSLNAKPLEIDAEGDEATLEHDASFIRTDLDMNEPATPPAHNALEHDASLVLIDHSETTTLGLMGLEVSNVIESVLAEMSMPDSQDIGDISESLVLNALEHDSSFF